MQILNYKTYYLGISVLYKVLVYFDTLFFMRILNYKTYYLGISVLYKVLVYFDTLL